MSNFLLIVLMIPFGLLIGIGVGTLMNWLTHR
jgi:hypothetical protein